MLALPCALIIIGIIGANAIHHAWESRRLGRLMPLWVWGPEVLLLLAAGISFCALLVMALFAIFHIG